MGTGFDDDGNQKISKAEFQALLVNPKTAKMVQEVGVDVVGLVDFADFIFKDGVELSFSEFMALVLQLRGSNTATVKDIVDLRKFIALELQAVTRGLARTVRDDLVREIQSTCSEGDWNQCCHCRRAE